LLISCDARLLARVVASVLSPLVDEEAPSVEDEELVALVDALEEEVSAPLLDEVPNKASRSLVTALAAVCALVVSPDDMELRRVPRSLAKLANELSVLSADVDGGGGDGGLVRFARSCSTLLAADCSVVVSPDCTALRSEFRSVRN
jgi:hypothetical protein